MQAVAYCGCAVINSQPASQPHARWDVKAGLPFDRRVVVVVVTVGSIQPVPNGRVDRRVSAHLLTCVLTGIRMCGYVLTSAWVWPRAPMMASIS
jgi:hypothetical protein